MQSRTACGGKKSETLLSGKRKRPGDLRGDVIADGARQDVAHRAERCPGGASLWSGVYPPATRRRGAALAFAEASRFRSGSRGISVSPAATFLPAPTKISRRVVSYRTKRESNGTRIVRSIVPNLRLCELSAPTGPRRYFIARFAGAPAHWQTW